MGGGAVGSTVKISRLPEVVDWLVRGGISLRRIADVTDTTHANARAILSRHRRSRRHGVTRRPAEQSVEQSRSRPARRMSDVRRADHCESLQAALRRVVRSAWCGHDFHWGIQELTLLGQYLGYYSQPELVHIAAERQFHLSAFNVHLGRTESAARHAHHAQSQYRRLIDKGDRLRGLRGISAAKELIAHALLLEHRPFAALEALVEVESLSRQHGLTLGAEFHRKRGVALLQISRPERDREAARMFRAATEAPHSVDTPLERRMSGERHQNLLNQSFDDSAELLRDAVAHYGEGSLQHSMCLHWSAAIALATDSDDLNQYALDSLANARSVVSQFGHQATIHFLLSRTHGFGVPQRFRKEWVRLALYSNAFRGTDGSYGTKKRG